VKVGIHNGDDAQIIEGVKDGDKVVTNGAYGLPDKTKIKVEAPEPPGGQSKPSAEGSKLPSKGSDEK
jgi:hypothetical protein